LTVEVEEGLPPIQGDRRRLTQALNKIIANAGRFPAEDSITLHAFAEGGAGAGSDNGWICIEVQNSGGSMNDITLEDDSSPESADGASLGLLITHQLVHLHGGEFDVHRQPGQGSTFIVRLPIRGQAVETSAQGD
jgi:signal transduction histidine kinase